MISPSLSGLRMLASQGARVRFERDELPTLHEWFRIHKGRKRDAVRTPTLLQMRLAVFHYEWLLVPAR